jgi:hypothetical protein
MLWVAPPQADSRGGRWAGRVGTQGLGQTHIAREKIERGADIPCAFIGGGTWRVRIAAYPAKRPSQKAVVKIDKAHEAFRV